MKSCILKMARTKTSYKPGSSKQAALKVFSHDLVNRVHFLNASNHYTFHPVTGVMAINILYSLPSCSAQKPNITAPWTSKQRSMFLVIGRYC